MPTTSAHGSARDILSGLRAREFVSALILTDDSHGDEVLDAVHAHAAADGLPVVRLSAEPTTGTAASAPRPGDMSALRGLVDQVLASAESITTEQRSALRVAFGIEMGPPPTRLMLCTVIVSLLHAWAGEHPGALLLIDRADRLDPSSADILAPVIRRLRHTGVQAVFSSAPGDTVFDDRLAERIWPDEPLPPPADAENRTARTGVDFDESVVAARAAASDDSASTTALLAPTPAHSPSGLEHAVAEAFSSFAQGHPTGPVYAALLSAVTAHHDHTDRRLVDDAVWLLTFLEQCTGDGARDGLRAVLRSLPNAPVWTRIDGRMQLAESPDAAVDQADRLVDDLAVASDPDHRPADRVRHPDTPSSLLVAGFARAGALRSHRHTPHHRGGRRPTEHRASHGRRLDRRKGSRRADPADRGRTRISHPWHRMGRPHRRAAGRLPWRRRRRRCRRLPDVAVGQSLRDLHPGSSRPGPSGACPGCRRRTTRPSTLRSGRCRREPHGTDRLRCADGPRRCPSRGRGIGHRRRRRPHRATHRRRQGYAAAAAGAVAARRGAGRTDLSA